MADSASDVVYPFVRRLRSKALPVLLDHVDSQHLNVRNTVVRSFTVLGWTAGSALPQLRAMAREGPADQRKTAALAIEIIHGRRELNARAPFR